MKNKTLAGSNCAESSKCEIWARLVSVGRVINSPEVGGFHMLLSRGNTIFAVGFVCLACAATHANANLLTNGSFELGTLVNDGNATQTFSAGPTAITGWTAVGRQVSWIEAGNPFGITAQDGSRFLDLAGGTSATFTDSAATTTSTWVPFSLPFTATSASTAITLTGAAGVEYIGLDNVDVELVGGPPDGVPEPGTYALTALGFGALAVIIGRSRKPDAPRL